jgi:hypothetical protein
MYNNNLDTVLVGILIPAVCVHDLDTKLQQIALQAAGDS